MIFINNQEKLNKLHFQKDNYYVVSDFDQTITKGTTKGSWAIDIERNNKFEEERATLYNYYRPIEIDNTIDYNKKFNLMKEWYEKSLRLLIEHGVKEQEIISTVKTGKFELRNRS